MIDIESDPYFMAIVFSARIALKSFETQHRGEEKNLSEFTEWKSGCFLSITENNFQQLADIKR